MTRTPRRSRSGPDFLLYGANGYVGRELARQARDAGLRPLLAGRDAQAVGQIAQSLDLEHVAFGLDDTTALERALQRVPVVLHGAGPYLHTATPMVRACLRSGTHYLDLTGELPVYEAIAAFDAEARAQRVMLMPAVGFDVVPTDCLAVHLKRRLPGATRLTIAFAVQGPAGLPPGTQRTAIELIPYGDKVRRDGRLVVPSGPAPVRRIDFGRGPQEAVRLTWGDVFTAWHSTGIPNIEDYAVLPRAVRTQLSLTARVRPLFRLKFMRDLAALGIRRGATPEECARSSTHVWAEVEDAGGRRASARLHGPEAGLVWTVRAALAAVRQVLAGDAPPGYQTPGRAWGADFVLACEGVDREDVE
jgi:short subunit dehydrogenase-like uncharacterized protein